MLLSWGPKKVLPYSHVHGSLLAMILQSAGMWKSILIIPTFPPAPPTPTPLITAREYSVEMDNENSKVDSEESIYFWEVGNTAFKNG